MLFKLLFRLDIDTDKIGEFNRFFIIPRLFIIITLFLWTAIALLFKRRIYSTIKEICPLGTMAALGGKAKRNIITLGIVHVHQVLMSLIFILVNYFHYAQL